MPRLNRKQRRRLFRNKDSAELIRTAKICPYCGEKPQLVDSSVIYNGRSYGMIYLCKPCNAYVGCHKNTTNPLGRLADKDLREWKKMAHKYFDNLWARSANHNKITRPAARKNGYAWLSKQLDIEYKYCHIGMFDVETCKEVVDLCKPYYREL